MKHFAISAKPIDPDVMRPGLRAACPGAYLEYQILVAGEWEGRAVAGLDVEAVPELSEREAEALIGAILARRPGVEMAGVCRVGSLAVGDCVAWIGLAGPRFESLREALDELVVRFRERVPLWQRLVFADGGELWLQRGGE